MSEGTPSTSLDSLTTFDNSPPLVFCNQYLNPDNSIVADDGRLWLMDWPVAGSYFYPPGLNLQQCEYRRGMTSNTGMLQFPLSVDGISSRKGLYHINLSLPWI